MTRTLRGGFVAVLVLALLPFMASAQEAVIITGRVTAGSVPLRGASVRIPELDLVAVTNAAGAYRLIVPSARVRGQTVTLTVRHVRHDPQSVQVALVGGALERNFDLVRAGARPREEAAGPRVDSLRVATMPMPSQGWTIRVDSSAFVEASGPVDLPAALAGRLAGVEVQTASTFQGSSALQVRGPHTIMGATQPLYVVDGILLDNANVADVLQRQGLGGFDHGSGISDVDLFDVASVEVLRGPVAALEHGGRGANGVVRITTRGASSLRGFVVSGRQQLSSESPLRLPEYQNGYGQGRAGAFAFFDGQGGGVNDGVAENWGPALLGQPIAQASLAEAGRPDVRFWSPRPDNVRDWYERGRTVTTNVAAQAGNGTTHARLSFGNRIASGLTPEASGSRQSVALTAATRALPRVQGDVSVRYIRATVSDRPATGLDPANPAWAFAHMGRQVDVAALRNNLRDVDGEQISWNYAGYNNPWFAPFESSNEDRRGHLLAGGHASALLSRWLTASARLGIDRMTETRELDVASGWMGGHAFAGGRGDFSTGGWQDDDVRSSTTSGELALRAALPMAGPTVSLTAGIGRRAASLRTSVRAADSIPGGDLLDEEREASGNTTHAFGQAHVGIRDLASLTAGVRRESSALEDESHGQSYPSVLATVDLARLNPGLRAAARLEALTLRAGWGVSGNELTPALLQQLGLLPAIGATTAVRAEPERTTALEFGAGALMLGGRLALDLAWYDESSEHLIGRVGGGEGGVPGRIGSLSNTGVEAQLAVVPLRTPALEWRVDANLARNSNRVESIEGTDDRVQLDAPFQGSGLFAVEGEPLHAIVGTRLARDAAGNLLLRDGLPAADVVQANVVLGSTAPDWLGGIGTSLRFRGLEVAVLFDLRRGGEILSASNHAGITTGSYAETAIRPDTGLLIAGTDVNTGAPNTVHVSTEAYFRALGAVGEPWVYDASFTKLREARLSFTAPLHRVPGLRAQGIRVSVVGRNLALWATAPHIDPETLSSTGRFRGLEMGQHPAVRSVGVQVSVIP